MKKEIIENIEIPEGIKVELIEDSIVVSCDNKKLSRKINGKNIELSLKNNELIILSKAGTKRENKQIMTLKAHINNMLKGVKENFRYVLEIAYVHFPMNVKIENNELVIRNFLGEKKPRVYKIPKNVEVKLEGNQVIVESYDKELAGQVSASIEKTTKVRKRDIRKFQDGIYIVEKAGRKI